MRTFTWIAIIMLAGCAAASPGGAPEGTFRATGVTENGRFRDLAPGSEIRLTFADGGVTATGGCNTLTARVRVSGDDGLTVSELITTDRACEPGLMAQDDWLAAFLEAGPSWSRDGGHLVLRAGTAEIRLTG